MSIDNVGLALSGGALRGAFSVGAVKALAERGITTYDAVSGTSTGALIAPFALLEKFDVLEEAYGAVAGDDVYKLTSRTRLLFDAIQNFLETGISLPAAVGSFDPLRKRIAHYLSEADWSRLNELSRAGRSLYLTTVDLDAEQLVYWSLPGPDTTSGRDDRLLPNKSAIRIIPSRKELINVMVASSTIPIAAPPVRMPDGHSHVDGGVQEHFPAWVCIAHGVSTLYAITTEPKKTVEEEEADQRPEIALGNYNFRSLNLRFTTGKAVLEKTLAALLEESFADEVRYLFLFANRNRLIHELIEHATEQGYTEVIRAFERHREERYNLRELYFIAPRDELDAPSLEEADPEKMRAMIREGFATANEVLGPRV